MKTVKTVFAVLCVSLAALAGVTSRGALLAAANGPRTIEIKASDTMKYDVTAIQARRGEQLRIRLIGIGTMPKIAMSHNWVLLKSRVSAKAFADKAMLARATAYIPPDLKAQVIIATPLIGNGERAEVVFTAPSAPGQYEYICTFPGHFTVGMKGVLTVT